MSFPSFTAWQFAAAGALFAAGPVIIHLLNRRRYRVVQWAAMDFLKEALQRNRRMLQLRDIILLVMRTIAVLLFGLVLARPFFTRGSSAFDDRQPLHAVIVIDNSLSMGYEGLDGTLLDKAKDRAARLIDQLPTGSKISVLPACGSREGYSPDPYDTKDGALEAIGKLELVDRSASLLRVANDVQRASEASPELAKRVVVFSDQQATNWRDVGSANALQKLHDWQLVAVAPAGSLSDWENTWISNLQVADGLADIETPTTITVQLQHQGGIARQDVQVKLSYGDVVIGEKTVSIEPGSGSKEVEFEYVFNTLTEVPEPDHPVFVALKAEIQSNDSLAADNERYLALPVVAGLPVVFVDQYGAAEDPARNQLGETRHLRKLLAPKTSRAEAPRQLVKIRHLTQGELDQETLQDARLVVLAGLKEPQSEEIVTLLRDYVRQGGRLVIAAGADFDPVRWQELAWRDGDGILPLPLRETVGEVPEVAAANTRPFFISFDSLSGDELFQLATTADAELRDLYSEPFFFKAVTTDNSPEAMEATTAAARKRLEEELTFRQAAAQRREEFTAKQTSGQITTAETNELQADDVKMAELRPNWLSWAVGNASGQADEAISSDPAARTLQVDRLLQQQLPRVLAKFDDRGQTPFLIAKSQGKGEVLFVATGLLSSWNTLPKTNAILMFDRLLRNMTRSTLQRRNYQPLEQLTLPLPTNDHDLAVSMIRPRQLDPESLDIGFIGNDQRGMTLHGLYQRGVYRVSGYRRDPNADVARSSENTAAEEKPVWEVPIVVNGDADESELQPLTREKFEELTAGTTLRWVEPGEDISLAGAAIRGQTSWWYLALAVLILLLAEMVVLSWPALRPQVAV